MSHRAGIPTAMAKQTQVTTDIIAIPQPVPCRLYVILAREAPVGVIVRLLQSGLTELIKWHTDTDTFERGNRGAWSRYATDLYTRLRDKARSEGWLHKLTYLLYEGDISVDDAPAFAGFEGVLLQDWPADDGRSRNPAIAQLQGTRAPVAEAGTSLQEVNRAK